MNLRLHNAHFPVTVLGAGRRVGIWVQGCGIGCRGCIALDTWEPDPRTEVPVDLLVAWCRDLAQQGADGLTISGGEPFDQTEGLEALVDGVREFLHELTQPFDILCYSGYPLARLLARYEELVRKFDALIPEPFRDDRPRGNVWRGSDNQPLIALTELGRQRYIGHSDEKVEGKGKVQLAVSPSRISYIGIPDRQDMERLQIEAEEAGLGQRHVSWLP